MLWIGFLSYLFDHVTIVTRENTVVFGCSFGSMNTMGKTNSVIWFRLLQYIHLFFVKSVYIYILYTHIFITYPKWRSLKNWKGHSWVQTGPLWRTWSHTYFHNYMHTYLISPPPQRHAFAPAPHFIHHRYTPYPPHFTRYMARLVFPWFCATMRCLKVEPLARQIAVFFNVVSDDVGFQVL